MGADRIVVSSFCTVDSVPWNNVLKGVRRVTAPVLPANPATIGDKNKCCSYPSWFGDTLLPTCRYVTCVPLPRV